MPRSDKGGASVVSRLEIPALAISSTDCRARVKNGHPVWYLVPDGSMSSGVMIGVDAVLRNSRS
jgi:nicotinic acid mononucleotide adenylyltransferase